MELGAGETMAGGQAVMTGGRTGKEGPGRRQLRWLLPVGRRALKDYRVEFAMLGVLVVLSIIGNILYPELLSSTDIGNILDLVAALFLMAVGQVVVLITGGIDLSVGSTFALASVAFAIGTNDHGEGVGLIVGLGVGLGIGAVNGFLVAVIGLAPFIVTLASDAAGASLALVVTNGETQSLPNSAERVQSRACCSWHTELCPIHCVDACCRSCGDAVDKGRSLFLRCWKQCGCGGPCWRSGTRCEVQRLRDIGHACGSRGHICRDGALFGGPYGRLDISS